MPEKLAKPHTFTTLDGLRGAAAIAIIPFHLARFFAVRPVFGVFIFTRAYLAVDFFFMLSGFVLAFAYQKRLDEGWPTSSFVKTRLIRLYPLYILGLLLGLIFTLLRSHFVANPFFTAADLWVCMGFGIFFLPVFINSASGILYPLDVSAWSLFFELAVNIFHAVFLRKRSLRVLYALLGLSGLWWVYTGFQFRGLDYGFYQPVMLQGLCRTLFPYLMGIVLYRTWFLRKRTKQVHTLLPLLAVSILLCVPDIQPLTLWMDFATVALAFPLIIYTGASSLPGKQLAPVFRLLGNISYPIYILHFPLGFFWEQAWKVCRGRPIGYDAPWGGLAFIMVLVVVCATLVRLYDMPMRSLLSRKFLPPKKADKG